jgi:hypothetical protein
MAVETNGMPRVNGAKAPLASGNPKPDSYASKHTIPAHFIGGNHLAAAAPGAVKDWIAAHDGHTVITSVRTARPGSGGREANAARFSSPTMELRRSRKSDPSASGRTRRSKMRGRSNLPSWRRQRICRRMPITSEWRISMWRYGEALMDAGQETRDADAMDRSPVVRIITTTPTWS